jgi:hypothetical protein
MTTQDSPAAGQDAAPGAALAGYLEAMDGEGAALLGHLVLYSVFDSRVTRDDVGRWFIQLGLDSAFVPPPIRAVDAFEKVTGPAGIRVTYSLDDPRPSRRRRRQDGRGREATLMIRHVRRDGSQIVRHVVREVRDEASTKLSYDTRLGECTFRRDGSPSALHGAGALQVTPDRAAIRQLPAAEQEQVGEMLAGIEGAYQRHRTYLTADRLRTVIRTYVESLHAIRVRPTGGVYFVSGRHAATLAALRDLVSRFGAGSHLSRIPLPDQEEMREMIVTAFTTRSREDLDKLARDIAAARQEDGGLPAIQSLHKRFTALQAAAAEHSGLLAASLDDTTASLQLVSAQLASLLARASS